MNLTETRRHVDRLFARRDLLNTELDTARTQAVGFTKSLADHKEALPVLIAISSAYRRAEVARIQKAVSMALQAVFGRAYEFKLKQVPRRGQVELEPLVVDGTMELDLEGVGGGIKDIVSLVLRVVLWSKQAEATDPVILLDEPARCVNTPDAIRQLSMLMQQLSEAFGIQFVNVTNRAAFKEGSGQVLRIERPDMTSVVTTDDGVDREV